MCPCSIWTDNFLTYGFLEAVLSAQEALPQSHWLYGSVNTSDPGTTGRIWMNLSLFFHVGGYDEDTQPSGYQDVDLRRRLEAASKKKEALPRIQKIDRQVISGGIGAVGGTMANSTVSRSVDRGEAKIRNCAPEVRASFATWHQMNTVIAVACQERLKKGHIMRNKAVPELGAWFRVVSVKWRGGVAPYPGRGSEPAVYHIMPTQPAQPPPAAVRPLQTPAPPAKRQRATAASSSQASSSSAGPVMQEALPPRVTLLPATASKSAPVPGVRSKAGMQRPRSPEGPPPASHGAGGVAPQPRQDRPPLQRLPRTFKPEARVDMVTLGLKNYQWNHRSDAARLPHTTPPHTAFFNVFLACRFLTFNV